MIQMRKIVVLMILIGVFISCDNDSNDKNNTNTNNLNTNNVNTNNATNMTLHSGENWELINGDCSWSGRAGFTSVVFNDRIWVMGGFENSDGSAVALNDVWSSVDGTTWVLETDDASWSPRVSHSTVVFNDKLWVMGGNLDTDYYNDVWSSADGVNWFLESDDGSSLWSDRKGSCSVVFNNRMWIIGGVDYGGISQVYSTLNGKEWVLEVEAPFEGRGHLTCEVFNNKIYLIGGHVYTSDYYDDVWSSEDGVNWVLETDDMGLEYVYGHSSLVYDGKLWVAGGNGNEDGILTSSSGKVWTGLTITSPFGKRSYFGSVVFNDRICLLGGSYTENMGIYLRNDMWCTKNP
jgi:leucine-zipper-like transcriptional regulator 1